MSREKLVLGTAIGLSYILMVVGNLVTTTGSGMACPDWPLCYGTVIPPPEVSVWTEWMHRILGGVTGVFILGSAFFIWKRASGAMKFFFKTTIALIGAAVLLGGAIIIIDAPMLDSFMRITVVSSHIVVSTVIFCTMIVALRSVSGAPAETSGGYDLYLFILVFAQVVLGIVVRYSHSSLACPDWPLCQGSVLPPDFSFEVLIHYTHRLVAYAVFGVTLWKLLEVRKAGGPVAGHAITFALVLAQASIGIGIVQTLMFLPLLVFHGVFGFGLVGWAAWRAGAGLVPAVRPRQGE